MLVPSAYPAIAPDGHISGRRGPRERVSARARAWHTSGRAEDARGRAAGGAVHRRRRIDRARPGDGGRPLEPAPGRPAPRDPRPAQGERRPRGRHRGRRLLRGVRPARRRRAVRVRRLPRGPGARPRHPRRGPLRRGRVGRERGPRHRRAHRRARDGARGRLRGRRDRDREGPRRRRGVRPAGAGHRRAQGRARHLGPLRRDGGRRPAAADADRGRERRERAPGQGGVRACRRRPRQTVDPPGRGRPGRARPGRRLPRRSAGPEPRPDRGHDRRDHRGRRVRRTGPARDRAHRHRLGRGPALGHRPAGADLLAGP